MGTFYFPVLQRSSVGYSRYKLSDVPSGVREMQCYSLSVKNKRAIDTSARNGGEKHCHCYSEEKHCHCYSAMLKKK